MKTANSAKEEPNRRMIDGIEGIAALENAETLSEWRRHGYRKVAKI